MWQEFKYRGNYFGGRFAPPLNVTGEITSVNPGDLADTIASFPISPEHVDAAVSSAREAFPAWRDTSQDERTKHVMAFKDALEERSGFLQEMISRETGKPLWESAQEVAAVLAKFEITINEGLAPVRPFDIGEVSEGVLGQCRYKPRGPVVILGPFNMPAHLPNGHIVPALLTGNTVILKPSRLTPAVGQVFAEAAEAADLPNGILNIVQGDHTIGHALVTHPDVAAILFTGSYQTGKEIQRATADDPWKLLAMEMGGKNCAIVMDDADVEQAATENVLGAFLTTGQRCSSTSRIVVHRHILREFIDTFSSFAEKLRVGFCLDERKGARKTPFMGPLISESARDRFLHMQDQAQTEGAEEILRGQQYDAGRDGYYVTPSVHLVGKSNFESTYQQTEIFGPDVALFTAESLEEAIAIANDTAYGLTLSVFTADRSNFEKVFAASRTGVVNWNRGTAGASSRLPFGGLGKSGNGWPTGLSSTRYCTYPVASLEREAVTEASPLPPGIER